MRGPPYTNSDGHYTDYYAQQAGRGLPGFVGAPTQYGNGLGGVFRSLFRFAMPLLRGGFNMAKPHLKTAAKNIVGDVVSHLVNRTTSGTTRSEQEGSGLMYRGGRGIKRPPSNHAYGRGIKRSKLYKEPTKRKKKTQSTRCARRILRPANKDIF